MAMKRGEDGTLPFSLSFFPAENRTERGGREVSKRERGRETETERADRELTLNN